MTQTATFGGVTYDPALDEARLEKQLGRVFELMSDGHWRTLSEIGDRVGGSESGVSARLRDLRKKSFGAHTVNRRRRGPPYNGLFEYQLLVKVAVA